MMLQIGDLGKFYLCGRDDCLKHGFVSFLSGLNKSWEMNGVEDVIHSCTVALIPFLFLKGESECSLDSFDVMHNSMSHWK